MSFEDFGGAPSGPAPTPSGGSSGASTPSDTAPKPSGGMSFDDFTQGTSGGRKAIAADTTPSTATQAFVHHAIANLPGGEDLAAMVEAPFTGRSVTEQKHAFQESGAQEWEEHPWASGAGMATSIGGQLFALPVAGPEEALAYGITKAAPSAARIAPTLARTGVGAGYGAIYSGTSGPDLWNTQDALTGAAIGGAGAAVAPVLTKAATGAARWAGLADPGQEAAGKVAEAFKKDQPAGGAIDQPGFAAGQAAKQPVMAADLGGENVRELADVAQTSSPDARKILKDKAAERYATQGPRYSDFLDSQFPGKDLNTATQQDEIDLAERQTNSTAYRAAYNDPNAQAVWSGDLANLMRDPNVQAAIPKAQSKAASAAVSGGPGVQIPQNPFVQDAAGNWDLRRDAQGNAVGIPGLQWWDYVNRSLGDQVTSARRAGNMDDARVVGGIQKQLQGALDAQVPQFAQARASAAGFFNEEKLVDSAIKFDKTTDENTINTMLKDLQSRPDADREVFARAYAAQLKQRALNPTQSVDLAKQFGDPTGQRIITKKMQGALNTPSNPTRAQTNEAWWLREQAFNKLYSAFGNSKTAQRQAAQAAHGAGGHGLVGQVLQGFTAPVSGAATGAIGGYEATPEGAGWDETLHRMGMGAAGGALFGWLAQRHGKVNADTWREVARQLASNDPNVYQNALDRVGKRPLYMDALRKALTTLPAIASGTRGPFNN